MTQIAIVNQFGTIPGESGYSRTHYIAQYLSESGVQVDFICGSFNHWTKRQKDDALYTNSNLPYHTVRIQQPDYPKNISIKRLLSLNIYARNLKNYLYQNKGKYNLIINVMPPSKAGAIVAKFCKSEKIPFVIDLNDLWPEAMGMVIKNKVIINIVTYPMKRNVDKVYAAADGIIGTSDTYRDRPLLVNKKDIPKITVYVGTDIDTFDKGINANIQIPQLEKDGYWVTYAGTLGASYDIHTLIKAGGILKKKGYKDIKIMILGDGPLRKDFEVTAKEAEANVDFKGYMPYDQMAAYLKMSDILINSFIKSAPQSIVNKIGDYLSAGKPMINTGSDKEFRALVTDKNFGINVEAENPEALADAIELLYQSKDKSEIYSKNARETAEKYFDRKTSYQEIIKLVRQLTQ